jgi:hypothetical protein
MEAHCLKALSSRPWYQNPIALLALTAGLLAFVVQSGELGSADTMHRLQSAHALWTSEPPVFPQEFPEFGVHGRDGKLQSWYSIGQSLLLLPFDIAGTYIERLPLFDAYGDTDPSVRDIFVSYCTNILVTVLTALVCCRFLRQLQFDVTQAVAGTLAFLVATTHLHYTQNMMENNYICLLSLVGFSWQYDWLRTGNRRSLALGAGAFGLNLLTRLPTGLDLICGALFLLVILWLEGTRGRALWQYCRTYVATVLPIYLIYGVLDRLYQWYRFGPSSIWHTYITIIGRETRRMNPSLPPNYPFETPWHVGFFGALFAPEKSIFLFDPLLILMILLCVLAWRRFSPPVKAWALMSVPLLLAYMSFYGRYTVWSGDFAWGDRYVSTAVELSTLLAVPLLLRHRGQLSKPVWIAGVALLSAATIIQLASLLFWLPLEIYQMETFGHPTFVIALRMRNIAAFTLGKMGAWGLNTHAMTEDPWDYVHITAWNFLPFLLRRVGAAPAWVVNLTFAALLAGLAALAATAWRLYAVLRTLSLSKLNGQENTP